VYIEKQTANPTTLVSDVILAFLTDSNQSHVRHIGNFDSFSSTSNTQTTKKYRYAQIKFNETSSQNVCGDPCKPGTVTSSKTICSGQTVNLSYSGLGSVQWQQSSNGSSGWTNVSSGSGGTTKNYTSGPLTSDTYYRVIENATGCPNMVSNVVKITVSPLPDAAGTITGKDSVCPGDQNVAYSVPLILNATSYEWSYTGSGATISGTTRNITISFSNNATSGKLTVKGKNACGDGVISTDFDITVKQVPVITITPTTQTICSGDKTNITFSSTPIGATFDWTVSSMLNASGASSGSGNVLQQTLVATLNVPGTVIYNVIPTLKSCKGNAGTVTITVNPPGSLNTSVSGNSPICQGDDAVFVISGNPGETISYSGVIGSPASPVVLDANGKATITVSKAKTDQIITLVSASNNGCSANLIGKTSTITVLPNQISVKLKSAITSCGSATGTVTIEGGGSGNIVCTGPVNKSFNGVTLNYDITGLSAGTYVVTFDNGSCIADTTFSLSDPGAPSTPSRIDASGPTTFCQGDSVLLTAVSVPGVINWTKDGLTYGNVNENPIKVKASGVYAVTVTVGGCVSSPLSKTVVINPLPVGPIGPDTVYFCYSEKATLTDLTTKVSGTSIKWYDGSNVLLNDNTLLVNNTTYYASQTLGGCESSNKLSVLVIVNTSPGTPSGSTDQLFCKLDDARVSSLLPTSSAGVTIEWYFNNTIQQNTTALQTGKYLALAVQKGCYSTNGLEVNVTIEDPKLPSNPIVTLCTNNLPSPMLYDIYQNSSTILYYSLADSVTALANKAISKGETYYVRTTTANGCLSSAKQITVPVSDGPTLSATPYTLTPVLCEKDKPTLDDVEAKYNTLPTSSGTIYWFIGQNDNVLSALSKNTQIASGAYWISVKDNNNCYSSRQQVNITVDAGNKPALKPIELCLTSEYKVSDLNVSNMSNPAGILTWYYANNGTNVAEDTIKVLKNQDYWATYKSTANSCESSEMVKLSITWIGFTEDLKLDNNTQEFCKSDTSYVSDLSIAPYNTSQIGWFEDELSKTPLPNNTELYEISYFAAEYKVTSDGKYCVSDKRDDVTVKFYSPKIYPTVKESVCSKNTGVIEFVNAPSDYTFSWYEMSDSTKLDFTGSKYTKPLEKQSFKIKIVDGKGCKDSIKVSMPACSDSPIPQIITPGKEDGNNDKWIINYSSKYKNVQVRIFNRWGGEVYTSAIPYMDDWDGKYKNEFLPTGTYYYVIDKGNGDPVETGYIELVN
jgi:gliding motility-associated-like protein